MNWLAHLFLSEATPEFRLGGMLPDLLPLAALIDLPGEFQRGIQCHRQIDAYTDRHPVFRRSVARFQPPLRRFGGIVTDLIYDHFLTRHWHRFSPVSLPEFLTEIYAVFEHYTDGLPGEARLHFERMRTSDLLGSYGDLAGLDLALRRLSRRLRRPVDLAASITVLERDYEFFETDFHDFFPQLVDHVALNPPPAVRVN